MQKDSLYVIQNEQIMDSQTGELITEEEFHNIFSQEIYNKVKAYKDACGDVAEAPRLGINKLKGVVYATVPVKNKFKFNKVFEVDMRRIMKSKILSTAEIAFIGCFGCFISFPTNEIIVENEYLTIEEMGKWISVSKNTMTNTLKKLEENEIIKMVKRHKQPPVIYFNPYLICGGKVVEYDTYLMFKDSIYNPMHSADDE